MDTPLQLSLNKRGIIKALYYNGTLSCADISKITGSSIPVVTKNIAELIDSNHLVEKGFAHSKGGRKPLTYSINPGQFYIVSVAMDQFFTKLSFVDLEGSLTGPIDEFSFDLYDEANSVDLLTDKVESFINNSGIDRKRIFAIGLAMPGFIDVEKGINKLFLNAGNKSVSDSFQKRTGFVTYVDNDSTAIALAELKFGSGRDSSEVMVINLGWGIGLGMVIDGKIFRGFSGFAGEFSHIPLFNNDKLCSCGKRGCLETEVSLSILEGKIKAAINKGESTSVILNEQGSATIDAIIAEANKGDDLAINLISEAAYHVGRATAILIHIMNPQKVILSGKGSAAGKLWLAPVQQAINELCIPVILNDTEVIMSSLTGNAQLIGAAALVIEHFDQLASSTHYTLNYIYN